MSTPQTMVFIDLTGSTTAYEAVGTQQAAEVISKIIQWIDRVVQAHEGQTVKFLGDGVLARFAHSRLAVEAAVFLQQNHTKRLRQWPEPLRMGLKIGIACGTVVNMGEDIYGDAVNLAARLSDMAGAHTIWASESVMADLHAMPLNSSPIDAAVTGYDNALLENVRYRLLGQLRVRGLTQPHPVFQIEWSEDASSDLMTVRGALPATGFDATDEARTGGIALAWLGNSKVFSTTQGIITIGRIPGCQFMVGDQRVSRQHASIEWTGEAFVLTDMSSFGTWVRFADNPASEVQLRRTQCILHSTGEIALGAPFTDFSAPVLAFHVQTTAPSALQEAHANRSLFEETHP